MIEFACACGKKIRVGDDLIGKKVRCPKCSQVSLVDAVPEPTPSPVEEVVSIELNEHVEEPDSFTIPASPTTTTVPPMPPAQTDALRRIAKERITLPPQRDFLHGIAVLMFSSAILGLCVSGLFLVIGIAELSTDGKDAKNLLICGAGGIVGSIAQGAFSEVLMILRSIELQLYRIDRR